MSWLIFYLVSICSLTLGVFIYLDPQKTFEIQRQFYLKINWDIRPVSFAKEMRNTQIMGASLIVFTVAALIYFFASF